MKKKLLLLFVLFILGGSIGISKVVVDRTPSTEKEIDDYNKRVYAVLVLDRWKNDLIIYEEEVCGLDNAFDRGEVLLEQFELIYQPGRINVVVSPRPQNCEP
ncbi:hypothetical protein [Myroides odoratus]|uniref:hypothetical protein n=1 Tax=Myroides odoratus TaxID=256 RepID=UPI00333FABEC